MKHFPPCPLDPAQYPLATALYEALGSWKPTSSRVRAITKAAICLLTTGEVNSAREAAKAVDVTEASLSRFRRSEHGKALKIKLETLFREGSAHTAIVNIVRLAQQTNNLSVAMRANEWLAAINGISPVSKAEVKHSGEVRMPGMMIIHPDAATQEVFDQIFPSQR